MCSSGTTGRRKPGIEADPRRAVGRRGEELAAAHLARLGFSPLACNVRTRHGEIDLIVCDARTIVFVEVKTRRMHAKTAPVDNAHSPLGWLHPGQRLRLRRLAAAWLAEERGERPTAACVRFDAIGVLIDPRGSLLRLDHVENAW